MVRMRKRTTKLARPNRFWPGLLLVATLIGTSAADPLDHFKCYKLKQNTVTFTPQQVTLVDQFDTEHPTVQTPFRFCNPVDKDGGGILDPAAQLTCYRILDADGQPDFLPRPVTIDDQFTGETATAIRGVCRRISLLCVPPTTTSTTTITTTTTSTSSTSSTSTSTSSTSTTTSS